MRILMISAEAPPLQRAGALIDVLEALPHELRERDHEVGVVLPFYREIRENADAEINDTGVTVDVRVGEKNYVAEYLEGRTSSGVQLFFVRCDEFFDRPEIYAEHGVPYEDNAARFIFFNKAAVELARRLTPVPQILHLHDWAAALVPVYIRAHNLPFSTVLTIHRIAEQGSFWGLDFALTNLPQRYFSLRGVEFFGRLNFLKAGILFADRLTTVSEHHKHEILRPEFGCGLDDVLRENAHKLSGILHGADYARWNPETDPFLPAHFDPEKLWGKTICRDALLADLELAPAPRGPVFGMVTRIVAEKGFGILTPLFDRMLSDDVPLIPSRFEAGGLMAMYSLKYGALPVAHATGGIQEIVEDYDPVLDRGYGFLCYEYSADAFWDAIKRARELFRDREIWRDLMMRAMSRNFEWASAALRYQELYRGIAGEAELAA